MTPSKSHNVQPSPQTARDAESLGPDDLLVIDAICDEFELAWREGDEEPDINAYLVKVKPELQSLAKEELRAVAQHWRHQRRKAFDQEQIDAPEQDSTAPGSPNAVYSKLHHQFELLQRVGSGATGEVWKAIRRQTGEVVAIKIPHPALLGSLTGLIRFCREARWQTRLRHPRTGAPEEVVMAGELPVLVSRYIDGMTLKEYLRHNRMSVEQAVELVIQLADGLEYAHAMGIVHRDMKPANVLLERLPDGNITPAQPVIVDFGLAIALDQPTVTHDNQALGTPAYMSPEQARGGSHAAGVPSDIYSLGVIFFEALTGRLPIEGRDAPTLLHNVIYESPHPLRHLERHLPADLEQICAACLRKAPRERYQSARDLAEDLRRWGRNETIRMQRPSVASRLTHWAKRHPAMVTSAVSILLAVVGMTLWIVREAYLERLEVAYNNATAAIASAQTAQQQLESHLVAYRLGRIGAYWRLNNPEQARSLLAECAQGDRTWEWRHFNRLVTRYHRELRHARDSDEGRFTVRALAITSDGKVLYSGSRAGTIYRWDLRSDTQAPALLDTQPGGILAIACSPDDQLICYGTHHGGYFVRRTDGSGEVVHAGKMINLAVHSVAFSPNGRYVAIGGGEKVSELHAGEVGFLVVVDLESGEEVYRNTNFDRCLVGLDWHAQGDRLLGAGGVASRHPDSIRSHGLVWIWDTRSWMHQTFRLPRVARSVDWSSTDPDRFAVACGDGNHSLWSVTQGKAIKQLPTLNSGGMACQFSPNGRTLAIASEDGTCTLWDVADEQTIITYNAHAEGISSLLFASNQELITGGLDEFIRFWEAMPPQDASLDMNAFGKFASATQYGDHVLVAMNDLESEVGRIYAIRFAKRLSEFEPRLVVELPAPILKIACAPRHDTTLVAIAADDKLYRMQLPETLFADSGSTPLLDVRSRPLPFTVDNAYVQSRLHLTHVPGYTFANVVDFATVESNDNENRNRVWFAANDDQKFDYVVESTAGAGRCFSISNDRRFLATASDQNFLTIWTGQPYTPAWVFRGHERLVSALAFSPDGRQIASGSWDRNIAVWCLEDRDRLHTLKGHTGNVLAITYHPGEPRLFTAGADRQIRVWDTSTGIETATLTGHKSAIIQLFFDSLGETLMSIDDDGQIRCW